MRSSCFVVITISAADFSPRGNSWAVAPLSHENPQTNHLATTILKLTARVPTYAERVAFE